LGDEVALHEDLDGVLELEQVAEETAGRSRRLPRGEPVALGDAGPLEHLAIHLQMALLVGQLEQRRLLQLVERGVGGDAPTLGEIPLALASLHADVALPAEIRRVAEQRRVPEDESLARHYVSSTYLNAPLQGHPAAARSMTPPRGRRSAGLRAGPALHRIGLPAHELALLQHRGIHAAARPAAAQDERELLADA